MDIPTQTIFYIKEKIECDKRSGVVEADATFRLCVEFS